MSTGRTSVRRGPVVADVSVKCREEKVDIMNQEQHYLDGFSFPERCP